MHTNFTNTLWAPSCRYISFAGFFWNFATFFALQMQLVQSPICHTMYDKIISQMPPAPKYQIRVQQPHRPYFRQNKYIYAYMSDNSHDPAADRPCEACSQATLAQPNPQVIARASKAPSRALAPVTKPPSTNIALEEANNTDRKRF